MKKFLYSFLLVMLAVVVLAQDKAFTVMAVQGSVKNGTAAVNIGQQISSTSTIDVAAGGYLGLLHQSGNPLELKNPGSVPLAKYHKGFLEGKKSFQDKYMAYVVDGLAGDDNSSYMQNMGVTGSVERAISNNEIVIPLPSKTWLKGNEFSVSWMDKVKAKQYKVFVKNMKEETVLELENTSNSVSVNLSEVVKEKGQYLLLSVEDGEGKRKSNVVHIYIPTEEESTLLTEEMNAAKGALNMNSSVGCSAYAKICEGNKLYIEAEMAYKKAKELSPEIDFYKKSYQAFIEGVLASN